MINNLANQFDLEELKKLKMHNEIFLNNDNIHIWKKLENDCYIGTLGYSKDNIKVLQILLQSFAEQYGEVIDYNAANEELKLYEDRGKLFIYFDENLNPVSMNGCIYNEDNASVAFKSQNKHVPTSLYFYGLSTIPSYRGKGACSHLVDFAIEYAYYNNFDLVYARTDLVDSNSETIMTKAGLKVCTYNDDIIAEWVDVTDDYGDFRLHMWLPLKNGLYAAPKKEAFMADGKTREVKMISPQKQFVLKAG